MKKQMRFFLCILLAATLLCACELNIKTKTKPYAEEMMTLLKQRDVEAAVELLHPDTAEESDNIYSSMEALCDFLDGRAVTELKQQSVSVHNQIGTNAGKYESGTYRVVLEDGTVLKVEYSYLTNKAGAGFTSFYLSVGA